MSNAAQKQCPVPQLKTQGSFKQSTWPQSQQQDPHLGISPEPASEQQNPTPAAESGDHRHASILHTRRYAFPLLPNVVGMPGNGARLVEIANDADLQRWLSMQTKLILYADRA